MLKTFTELLAEGFKQPLYVSVDPDEATRRLLLRIQNQFNVPNAYSPDKMHCTLIYSKEPCKLGEFKPKAVYKAEFERFDTFDQQNGKKCLVVKLQSSDLLHRHKALMKEMGASYDYPQYLPHITLSYDIAKFDLSTMRWPTGVPVHFSNEKCVPLVDF